MNVLTQPATEWPVIAAEPADVASLYRDYIVILAAIPAVCTLIGVGLMGSPLMGTYALGFAVRMAIVQYVSALIGAYVAAFIIEKLAPNFGSSGNTAQALKLVAYASTPVWLAGVLNLIPVLAMLTLLAALYAIYLFYLGLAPVMKTPADKVVPYMIVSAIVIVLVYVCVGAIIGAIAGVSMYGRMF
jgi:hypothetical protein